MSDSRSASVDCDQRSTRPSTPREYNASKGQAAHHPNIRPFSVSFTDPNMAAARKIYFKTLIGGSFGLMVAMFAIFSIYWGALWKTPVHSLDGWVVVST